MAFAETANLAVKLTLGGNFTSQLAKSRAALRGFDKDASRAKIAGQQIGTGIKRGAYIAAAGVGVLASQVALGLDQLIELEQAAAQTEAVLKSTRGAAGQTADSIRNLSEKYESLNATMDDQVIQSGANVLLTFTNIRKEAFEPTLEAALNLSTAMKQDLQSSIVQIGKALNDPIRGVGALRRVGVQLSVQQEDQIKSLLTLTKEEQKHYGVLRKSSKGAAEAYKAGRIQSRMLQAQQIILGELNTEFGESFIRGGATTAARVAKFNDAIGDLQRSLASALLPAVSAVADELTKLLRDPATVRAVEDLSKDIAKLFSPENIRAGIGLLKDGFGAIRSIAGPIADVLGTAVKAFQSIPPDIQKLLVGGFVANKLTGGLVTNIAGGIFGALKAMTVQAAVVNVTGGIVNGGGIPGGGKGGLPNVLPGAGAAAGGLLGVGALTVGALVLAPAAIAALGLAMSSAEGIAKGRAATASARGIPDWNNKALQELKVIAGNTARAPISDKDDRANKAQERTYSAVEKMRGDLFGKLAASVSATEASKSAIVAATRQVGPSLASAMRPPSVYTDVKVYVTAAGVTKSVTQQTRYGPGNGSSGSTANSMVGGGR